MKKLIIYLFSVLFLMSCTDKKKQLISDYEQTIGQTKTDLNFKVNSLEFVKSITAEDSLNVLLKDVCPLNKDSINQKISFSNTYVTKFEDLIKKFSELQYDEFNNRQIELYKQYIAQLNYIKEKCTSSLKFIDNPKKIICNKWKCSYSIKNPFLNGVEQTITKYYLFNPENDKIISTEEK